MKNKKILLGIIAIVAIIFTLIACGGGRKLSGIYVDDDSNSITFSGNKFTAVEDDEKIEGTYEIKDRQIYFTFNDNGYQDEFSSVYSLKGNILTLDDLGLVLTKKTVSKTTNNKGTLAGKWYLDEGPTRNNPEDMELLKDGTGIVDGVGVSWKVENGRFYIMHPLMSFSSSYNVSNSTLTLKKDNGEVLIYMKN
jgi:hypothetical protein